MMTPIWSRTVSVLSTLCSTLTLSMRFCSEIVPILVDDDADLVKDSVRSQHLVLHLDTEHEVLLHLVDGGDITRPHLKLVLLQIPLGGWVKEIPPDLNQTQPLHHLPEHDVEELHVVEVSGPQLLNQPGGDLHNLPFPCRALQ